MTFLLFLSFLASTSAVLSSWAPVESVELSSYTGRWYQTYSDLAVSSTFENSSFCVTADYGFWPNGTVSVLNRERQYSIDGPERVINGWAQFANTSNPNGELVVNLQTTNFPAPYWIFELGPQTFNGSFYEYSVVSDPFQLTLFVLARNVTDFALNWEAGVLQRLEQAGYTTFYNTPSATVQEGCS